MGGLSEGELHVQAMRLVCEALADREQNGIEVDWNVLRQMHDQMDAMLQELQHKHRYDSSEIVDLRKDRDHWRQARQDAIEAGELMQAEIDSLRQQLDESQARSVVVSNEAANDKLQKIAIHCELRAAQDEIASLRQQLDAAQQPDVDAMQAFVGKVRAARDCYEWPQSWHRIEAALAELDAQPAPVAETAEDGT